MHNITYLRQLTIFLDVKYLGYLNYVIEVPSVNCTVSKFKPGCFNIYNQLLLLAQNRFATTFDLELAQGKHLGFPSADLILLIFAQPVLTGFVRLRN